MIVITHKGNFKRTYKYLHFISDFRIERILRKYGNKGVEALAKATPRDTGKTAQSWGYEIEVNKGSATIRWINENVNDGVNIAVILQYGHGTGTGGYVEGIDYINPALKPVFKEIAEDVWQEVTEV